MSTTAANTGLNAKQTRILEYLRARAPEQTYFKSRNIAADLELSAKEVGTNMPALCDQATDLSIEKWGYSSSTTWKVS